VPELPVDELTVDFSDTGDSAAAPLDGLAGVSLSPQFCEQFGLTPRQAEVLTLLLRGQANKAIARQLGLSVETVKDHVQAVLRALGVSSRTQAVLEVSRLQQMRRLQTNEPPPEWEAQVD
jgi:DNA-binding NarL/FixJ family response regulator